MRVSKEPEVRKQEMLDTAMRVFAEKGFEATTMKDIAAEMNVVSGLCYHYFKNKQQLYEEALTYYAEECSEPFIHIFQNTKQSMEECMESVITLLFQEEGNYRYASFFDKKGNEFFHRQLSIHMEEEIAPHLAEYLRNRSEMGEIHVDYPEQTALFILSGQFPILIDERIPLKERTELLRTLIYKILQ
ncbi:TetR/AcrR family transcriptional regulator [Eisenbergiella porci]|uniref:TetR/AcrR family transcriptional regulator n=1 Tax=Eisenbergiella porci TaxID=2652274 RepID=UPI002A8389E4|nr:helix-turn-helix domain-containing protein [Eisenbergiella porci]